MLKNFFSGKEQNFGWLFRRFLNKFTTLYNVCSVHRGMFSTSGDIMSTSGDIMSTSGVFSTSEGYHEYIGEMFSTSGGYHDTCGGIP